MEDLIINITASIMLVSLTIAFIVFLFVVGIRQAKLENEYRKLKIEKTKLEIELLKKEKEGNY